MKPTTLPLADHSRAVYHHVTDFDGDFEEALAGDYWEHVARQLRPGDIIQVVSCDGTQFAELLVRAATRNEASVGVLRHVSFDAAKEISDEYEVKYRGPAARYSVLRTKDGEVIRDKFQTAEEAQVWMMSHARAMAA